jgi:Lrp/AsnC family transcriptional regulator for asnA, asnC and gidA
MSKKEPTSINIDGIDKAILRALMNDARTPILKIARSVGISGAAIHQRLKKLEASHLISGSKFIINPKALGYTTMAFVGIHLDKAMRNPAAVKQLREIPEVLECHYTTGNWSVFIKIICRNNEHLMHLLNHDIQSIKGVSRTETFISLEQQIERQISI